MVSPSEPIRVRHVAKGFIFWISLIAVTTKLTGGADIKGTTGVTTGWCLLFLTQFFFCLLFVMYICLN